jgi:hypothetical protein
MRYHINQETGEPGVCRARVGECPYGSSSPHFESESEARKAYEAQMEDYEKFKKSPLGKLDDLLDRAFTAASRSSEKIVSWLDNHPKIMLGTAAVGALVGGYIAYKMGASKTPSNPSEPIQAQILDVTRSGVKIKTSQYTVLMGDGSTQTFGGANGAFTPGETAQFYLNNGVISKEPTSVGLTSAVTTGVGATAGGVGGLASGALAVFGIPAIKDYLDAKWRTRHRKRFSLLSNRF